MAAEPPRATRAKDDSHGQAYAWAVRVNVKGTSGSGKTTFAAELARRVGLPHVELDALHHGPNWSEPTADEFRARVEPIVRGAAWVIDGNYEGKLGRLVLDAADTIVWLDLPLRAKLVRLWRRTRERVRTGEELWESGNRETWRNVLLGWDSLFVWMLRSHFRQKWTFPRRIPPERLVRLRSETDAREWLERVPPRKRVIAYVTRQRDDRKELLVFDLPQLPGTPTQVPAGRLDPGEALEQGLERELYEETGLRVRRIVRELAGPVDLAGDRRPGVTPYENHAFEVEVAETPDEWEHVCVSDGDDNGYVFRCRWVPLEPDLALWRSGSDSVLPKLLEPR